MQRFEALGLGFPIIRSLLDVDHYKLTMWQFVFHRYANLRVRYGMINRTKLVQLVGVIDEQDLRAELDYARTLRFTSDELRYLKSLKMVDGSSVFKQDFLDFLGGFQLPGYILAKEEDGQYRLEFSGLWVDTIYWETIALSIVNELRSRALMEPFGQEERLRVYEEGEARLRRKIEILRPRVDILWSEFGTRRRFSRDWQEYEVAIIAKELSNQLVGTSNVYLAMKYGLVPVGTIAHETFMVMFGFMHGSRQEIFASHNKVLQDWWDEYGYDLSIALTDTYGTNFFFRDMTKEQAIAWKGLRHDSGDPIEFGERATRFYEDYGIDPQAKLLVFSDGLEVETIIQIADHFAGRIPVTFGWGTNLTNDLGFLTLSLVVKLIESNGFGVVKLSDNIAKATGEQDDIALAMEIFQYGEGVYEEVKY